jgi:hypothetical protein
VRHLHVGVFITRFVAHTPGGILRRWRARIEGRVRGTFRALFSCRFPIADPWIPPWRITVVGLRRRHSVFAHGNSCIPMECKQWADRAMKHGRGEAFLDGERSECPLAINPAAGRHAPRDGP